MKILKLSKTSWLILAIGLFILVMAGLGITVSQQAKEQGRLSEELTASQQSLAALEITGMQSQLAGLQQKAAQDQQQLIAAQKQLEQTIVSVDVTDKFFSIANACSVNVTSLNTSPITSNKYEGIDLSQTSINGEVEGQLPALINFVEGLNNNFGIGLVKLAEIDIPPVSTNETPTANVQIIIYSYEGQNNG
jgi:DNA-binding protein YbaB